jgi:hypothetical protein
MDHVSRKSPDTTNFAELEAVLARSLAARMVMAAFDRLRKAFDSSLVVSKIARLPRELVSYSHADRLRVIGAFIASFGVIAAILMAMIPVASASALPWAVWLGVAACGTALIVAADAFVAAWIQRRRRAARDRWRAVL